LRIRRAFGNISLRLETKSELEEKLPELNQIIRLLDVDGSVVAKSREPKPGFEDI